MTNSVNKITTQDDAAAVNALPQEQTLEQATAATLLGFLNKVNQKATETIEPYQDHQEMVILYNNLHKAINAATEADGRLNAEQFEKAVDKLRDEMHGKFEQKKTELEQDAAANQKALEKITAKHKARMDALQNVHQQHRDFCGKDKTLSKEQKERLQSNLDFSIKEHNIMMERLQHLLTKVNNEHSQAFQYAMNISKTLHQIKTRFLQGITGR